MDLHTLLGTHEDLPSVNMGREIDSLLFDLPKRGQREYLESAGVRQDRPVPGHKLVQAAHFPDDFIRGPQVKMISIGQFHLAADIFQILGAQRALDGTLGTHIHKHRSLNRAVGAGKFTPPGLSLGFL